MFLHITKIIAQSFPLYLVLVTGAYAGIFDYKSYEDCVLDSMKGVSSNVAANEIRKACRKKFPIKSEYFNDVKLPETELMNVTSSGKIMRYEYKFTTPSFEGTVENKTKLWNITKIKLSIMLKNKKNGDNHTHDCEASLYRPINIDGPTFSSARGISPLTIGEFKCEQVYAPKDYNFTWQIKALYGYKK